MNKNYKIFWKQYIADKNDFGQKIKPWVWCEGWSHNAEKGAGIFSSYSGAVADAMGLWEEYCEYYRTKKTKG